MDSTRASSSWRPGGRQRSTQGLSHLLSWIEVIFGDSTLEQPLMKHPEKKTHEKHTANT
jgi:hypothetical protein